MTVCAVKVCRNYHKTNKINKRITFHRFPNDPILADRWTNIIRRSRNESWWKPNPASRICSAHFLKKDKYITKGGLQKIQTGAIPTKALFLSSRKSDSDETKDSSDDADLTTTTSNSTEQVEIVDFNDQPQDLVDPMLYMPYTHLGNSTSDSSDNEIVGDNAIEKSHTVYLKPSRGEPQDKVNGSISDNETGVMTGETEISSSKIKKEQPIKVQSEIATSTLQLILMDNVELTFKLDIYKKKLAKKIELQKKHIRMIKNLLRKHHKLQKKNESLKRILKSLRSV